MTLTASPSVPLSQLLRDGSRAEHTEAETSSFMSELLAGRINERGYADYLARLRRVYEALETVGRTLADDPVAGVVNDPALDRLATIDADIAHWGAGDAASPATDAYVARVRASAAWGGLYLAHHYTRYLGDLSGGQIIGRLLAREFGLPDGVGVAFYEFAQIPKPKPYKDAYRARLDALDLDETQRLEVLAEVKTAFDLNGALFTELTQSLDAYRR